MNTNLRTAAATAALVTGLLAAGGTAHAAQRIDAQQLSAHVQKAVATAQLENGTTTGGPILGVYLSPGADSASA
ncbi:hypothetical protein ACFWXK_13490 [Streptomyces sp. NPDC059070]|uniref:hypothetical protein n=1 Tax=unclassified Streptomyces TaxID=2593676 RepID=UPI0034E24668